MGACGSYDDFVWCVESPPSSEQLPGYKWSKVDPGHAMKAYEGVEE